MLQLKELKLIRDLTGAEPWELKAVKFGINFAFVDSAVGVIATQFVPEQEALLVTRTQCYLTNIDNTASDYLLYRMPPDGVAYWILGRSITDTTGVYNVTPPLAPEALVLDTDEYLLFPPSMYANLLFNPTGTPPSSGTWQLRTTVYGYFVPPNVYETLGNAVGWINIQA